MYLYRHYDTHTLHTSGSVVYIPYILLDPSRTSRLHVLLDPLYVYVYVYNKYDICTFIDIIINTLYTPLDP